MWDSLEEKHILKTAYKYTVEIASLNKDNLYFKAKLEIGGWQWFLEKYKLFIWIRH